MNWLERYNSFKVSVPEGTAGAWKIERFEVKESDAFIFNLRSAGRRILPGTYTRLMRGSTLVMSDTPAEIRDHEQAIRLAKGHVLIHGLGLGMVLQAVARQERVERVTVIERSEDVLTLVAPHYQAMFGDRIEIIHHDAFEWLPPRGVRYGVVWHDIWDDITTDNLEGMTRLKRKYGRRCDWQGCWAEPEIRAVQREEKRRNWWRD